MMKFTSLFLSLGVLSSTVWAAIPAKRPAPPVGRILKGEGQVSGGLAGAGFTLLDLRRTADNKKKFERIVIDFGDLQGEPQKGLPTYFHAELKKNPHRLVVDFTQTPNSRVDEGRLSLRLKDSLFVKKSSMILDPEDKALNLSLDLKADTLVRISQVKGEKSTAKVVIDLFPDSKKNVK